MQIPQASVGSTQTVNRFSSTGQQLGQVHGFHRRPDAAQSALNVHQAADIAAGNRIGTGGDDVADFFVHHGNGYVRVFDGEGTPETAATVGRFHFDQFRMP
jgi:hypothetical protein